MPDAEEQTLTFVLLVWRAHFQERKSQKKKKEEICNPPPPCKSISDPIYHINAGYDTAGKWSNGKCNDFDSDKDNAEIYEVRVRVRVLGTLSLILFLIETAKSWTRSLLKTSICSREVCAWETQAHRDVSKRSWKKPAGNQDRWALVEHRRGEQNLSQPSRVTLRGFQVQRGEY